MLQHYLTRDLILNSISTQRLNFRNKRQRFKNLANESQELQTQKQFSSTSFKALNFPMNGFCSPMYLKHLHFDLEISCNCGH